MNTAEAIDGVKPKSPVGRIVRSHTLALAFKAFLSRLNFFTKFQPFMIGKIEAVDIVAKTAVIIDHKTERRIVINYEDGIERVLTTNKSKFVEIVGKIHMDRHYNPISISSVSGIIPVDTSDIGITEVLPSFLVMTSPAEPAIKVELTADNRFYSAKLESLHIFTCGHTRVDLKDCLQERVDSCWDEFVREDCSDLTEPALAIRERFLSTFREVEQ